MPNNTTVNKVIINGITRLDLTGDTATPSDVAQGKTFHDAAGILQTGTASGGGGDSWSWMGKNPTKIATPLNNKVYLKNTNFATWTPSTTATTMVASTTLSDCTIDAKNYDYVILHSFHTHFDYDTGTTGKAMITDQFASFHVFIFTYHSNYSDMRNDNTGNIGTLSAGSSTPNGAFYKNSSGADAYSRQSYGVYLGTPQNAAVALTYARVKTFPISMRCSSSYFSTANCALVNKDTSYYEYKIELWRIDHQTSPNGAMNKAIRDMWLNGGII